MTTAPVLSPTPELILTILSGPDKGASYKIVSQKIRIGRDHDNDIVLQDKRCSRHHATVVVQNQHLLVSDIGSRSGIILNGKALSEALIPIGASFQIGGTLLTTQWSSDSGKNSLTDHRSFAGLSHHPAKAKEPTTKVFFYVLVAVLGTATYFLLSQSTKKTEDQNLPGPSDQLEESETSQKRKADLFREKLAQGVLTHQGNEAQASYIQGFRDFREGHYGRAIQSFTATLALNSDHQLALKYKRLAEKKLDELVQDNMVLGRKYYEQNKFELARSAYKNVMILVGDPSNKQFLEAQERLQELELLLRGRY